ncbi:hypothetical protein A3J15_02545 [Candidatus Roizmanbacteria bacterium RIFCSPLOWO2_02_FULL_38_10]|uniref:4a-hydroxytetrahydrobiopterin dehydratase n=1 Tax=Candidatus Roizmanbacteria bacterium RIFCSPLOWO2_02_FULL_38_10 TaxID=1802074 RepID=A0A1F7JM82_9BACT|nr:MAG: hypothetical protein A3J15_02545 [Candidatus Roizmanbacteria bacterium RIFCSPLOWO2_02_FULL_38_10]
MTNLDKQKCVPCEGGTKPFTPREFAPYLSQVGDWEVVKDKKIEKLFKFKNFAKALEFVNMVGEIAEQEQHHPNIYMFGWSKVKITLMTHAIKGLSVNDFILATKINKIEGINISGS